MTATPPRFASPWWDGFGFLLSLGLALALSWQARDLIWSLWLSSLVIGYLTIVLGIVGSARRGIQAGSSVAGNLALSVFLLGFFTIHFGGFHLGHAVFLTLFFPLEPTVHGAFPLTPQLLGLVATSYWPWLLSAAIAERSALAQAWRGETGAGKTGGAGFNPMRPYLNVIRMHLLIFFFAASHFAGLDGVWVFCVVFAVYFLPWRMLAGVKRGSG